MSEWVKSLYFKHSTNVNIIKHQLQWRTETTLWDIQYVTVRQREKTGFQKEHTSPNISDKTFCSLDVFYDGFTQLKQGSSACEI